MRIGFGYDLHKLKKGRKLMIGGVHIPCEFGEEAHSDGDVLLHAIIDALFGAIAEGDIGSHFPPSDPQWKNISSL
ncbi:MAG: 2-C-methyl-D-erythritol 2,4-cyclodiphosphate synthase, partial [Spirochaetaceae bacterium]|nr:2-C-methyl-D-erythritol 2,4-cyclodiphosphate synthase [Spirochaetaceae bacterium]